MYFSEKIIVASHKLSFLLTDMLSSDVVWISAVQYAKK